MHFSLSAASLLLSLAAVAFAGTVPPNGKLGDPCGANTCADGLACKLPANPNDHRSGFCVPMSQIGGKCGGGSVRYPPLCAPNAKCVLPAKPLPGASGKCVEKFATEGQECGGGTRYALHCARGLNCVKSKPLPGAKGRCRRPHYNALTKREVDQVVEGNVGDTCGGLPFPVNHVCKAGLTCKYPAIVHPGVKGVCTPAPATLGQRCGGSIRYPAQCDSDLLCHYPTPQRPGSFGMCVPAAGEGQACGGAVRFPPQCRDGLRCRMPSVTLPGAHGTCVRTD